MLLVNFQIRYVYQLVLDRLTYFGFSVMGQNALKSSFFQFFLQFMAIFDNFSNFQIFIAASYALNFMNLQNLHSTQCSMELPRNENRIRLTDP